MARHAPAEVRRQQIFQAAIELCGERGYHRTRMDDIVARTGLSKGALYHHFPGKKELFLALLETLIDGYRDAILKQLDGSRSLVEVMTGIARQLGAMAGNGPALLRGLTDFYVLAASDAEFRDRLTRHYAELIAAVERLVVTGIERGEIAPGQDPNAVARVLVTGADGIVFVHTLLQQESRGTEAGALLVELLVRTLAPIPGQVGAPPSLAAS